MNVLTWSARILALLIILVFGLFAGTTGLNGTGPDARVIDVLMNLLPALIGLAALLLAWRKERAGGYLFIALGLAYMLGTRHRLDWSVMVGGPLVLTGLLFVLSAWRRSRRA